MPVSQPNFLTYLRFSFTFRLAVIYVAMFMVSFGILIALSYWSMVVRPYDDVLSRVSSEMDDLAYAYVVGGEDILINALVKRVDFPSDRKAFHVFLDKDGNRRTGNLPSWPNPPQLGPVEIEADRYFGGDEIDFQALSLDRVFADGARLIVGRDIEDISERRETLIEGLVWSGVLAIVLGGVGGIFMSMAVGKRIESINDAARKVIEGDLSGRVEMTGARDDFDRLAETLNMMLSRIEASMEAISRVSDSVAHELRLPLSRLHADLEDLATAADKGQPVTGMVDSAIAESERLKSVFESLLRIARIETGRHSIEREEVDLVRLVNDAVDLYQPEAEDHALHLAVTLPERLIVRGDANLLFQMMSNLLDNAIKFAVKGSVVAIELTDGEGTARFSVENEGAGIPPEHRQRVTERFYRVEDTPSQGLGLGLTLVKVTAVAHGGQLEFADTDRGFAVIVTLPLPPVRD